MTPAEFIEKAVAQVVLGLANSNADGVRVGHISVSEPLNLGGTGRLSQGGTIIKVNVEIPVAEQDGELVVVVEPSPRGAMITVPVPIALSAKRTPPNG